MPATIGMAKASKYTFLGFGLTGTPPASARIYIVAPGIGGSMRQSQVFLFFKQKSVNTTGNASLPVDIYQLLFLWGMVRIAEE